eukprot:21063-Chlamydomonas_euryale.AAC.2
MRPRRASGTHQEHLAKRALSDHAQEVKVLEPDTRQPRDLHRMLVRDLRLQLAHRVCRCLGRRRVRRSLAHTLRLRVVHLGALRVHRVAARAAAAGAARPTCRDSGSKRAAASGGCGGRPCMAVAVIVCVKDEHVVLLVLAHDAAAGRQRQR